MTPYRLTPAESDAVVRYQRGQRQGHVESVFIKFNLPDARALWLKFTILKRTGAQEDAVVEVWGIAFNLGPPNGGERVALKSAFPITEAQIERTCFFLKVGDIEWSHGGSRGTLRSPDAKQEIRWELNFRTDPHGFRHLPAAWMYRGSIPKSKATSPQVDTRFTGTVTVNGETTQVVDAPGMLGHNWGACHAESWTWAHCNDWSDGSEVTFEAVTSKVKFGPVTMPLLTVCHLRMPGEWVTMNGLLRAFRIKSKPDGLAWHLSARNRSTHIEASFSASPDRFVGVHYYDPDGRIIYCLNSKIADGSLRVKKRTSSGWREVLNVRSAASSALEVGDRRHHYGVEIKIP